MNSNRRSRRAEPNRSPVWEYSVAELGAHMIAHLTYGTVAERVFRSLS
jgi:hypothetical protein